MSLRDWHVMLRALAVAIAAMDRVPDHRDVPGPDRDDMSDLLDRMADPVLAGIFIESAERMMEKLCGSATF